MLPKELFLSTLEKIQKQELALTSLIPRYQRSAMGSLCLIRRIST